jgi:hypothetical protein
MPEPPPEPQPLARLIGDVYLGCDESFWSLPERARSYELLRRVFVRALSFRPPRQGWDVLAMHPGVHIGQYRELASYSTIAPRDHRRDRHGLAPRPPRPPVSCRAD